MRILRLAPTLRETSAPYNQFTLGLEAYTQQTFFSFNSPEIAPDLDMEVVQGDGKIIKSIRQIRLLLRSTNYDIVHIHNGLVGVLFFMALLPSSLRLVRRTVFTIHNSWDVFRLRNKFLNCIVGMLSRKVFACSHSSYDSLPSLFKFFMGEKISVAVNGFDDGRVRHIVDSTNTGCVGKESTSPLNVVCVGAFNDVKNQETFLLALAATPTAINVVFLGDGPRRMKAEAFASESCDVHSVSFKGVVAREAAIKHMAKADLFVSMSRGEGMPVAVLEGLCSGCYVILSDIPPHLEIAPPPARVDFLAQNDEAGLARILSRFAAEPSLVRSDRCQSIEFAESTFGMQKMLNIYLKAYRAIT